MSNDFRCWVYHATKAPKIINSNEYELACANGWADSPARFLKLESLGIDAKKVDAGDEDESTKAQQAYDAVEGVKQSLNGALNLKKMSKMELEDYAKEHFGVNLDRRLNPGKMIKQIKELMES
jgi:hypothetical protein